MGYQVYEDRAARDRGVDRWAGYGVPAICDMPDCGAEIDRGMGYRCEKYVTYEWDAELEVESEIELEGCELHFCDAHLEHSTHGDDVTPKPDTAEWEDHILSDESWEDWRRDNPRSKDEMFIRQQVRWNRAVAESAVRTPSDSGATDG